MKYSILVFCFLVSLMGNDARAAYLYEAEKNLGAGDVNIVEDVDALGKAFVQHPADYQPLFKKKTPKNQKKVSVWVRSRLVSLNLKTIGADGKQKELAWVWDKPSQWEWHHFGVFNREELGESLLIIRGPGEMGKGGIDAVVFAEKSSFKPKGKKLSQFTKQRIEEGLPSEETATVKLDKKKNIKETPETIKAKIDWNARVLTVPDRVFGLNAFNGFEPNVLVKPEYHKAMAYMGVRHIRHHRANMANDSKKDAAGWYDFEKKDWDWDRVKKTMEAWRPEGMEHMICISKWPKWMDQDGDSYLDPDQEEAFAKLCADLIHFINVKHNFKIEQLEITNELDGRYWIKFWQKGKEDRLLDLARIYNKAAQAVKKVDPSIKTGGPAAMRSDQLSFLKRFVEATKENLDFLSIHAYASGKLNEPDQYIYDKAKLIGEYTTKAVEMLKEISPDRPIETHLNEYNISWTWETREPRMVNHKGAVFDALCFVEFVKSKVEVTNAWNERDGVYGKMDGDFSYRPAAHVFHLVNHHMLGDMVNVTHDKSNNLVLMATRSDKGQVVLVINRSNVPNTVVFEGLGWKEKPVMQHRIHEKGYDKEKVSLLEGEVKLDFPAHSVSFYIVPNSSTTKTSVAKK